MNKLKVVIASIAMATTVPLGWSAISLPYHNECNDISTVTILNESTSFGSGWKATAYQGNSVFTCKQSSASVERAVHATLWTPALDIKTGRLYRVSVVVGSQLKADDVSKATIAMFASPAASASKTTILYVAPLPTFSTSFRPEPVEAVFVGDASKPYIGITDSGGGAISAFAIDDIIVEEYQGASPPSEVENLKAVPNDKTVDVSFKLPALTISGGELENIDRVSLLRNDREIMTWFDCQPGAELTATDYISTSGRYTYTVICTVDDLESTSILTIDIAGNATPSLPPDYEKDKDGNYIGKNYYAPAVYVAGQGIRITWKPADGATKYTVTRISDGKVIASDLSATEALDSDISLTEPSVYQYRISDGSNPLYISSVVSLNNTLPFDPSIGLEALNEFTVIDADKDSSRWTAVTSGSSDLHGASRYFANPRCGDDWLITPGITMEAGKAYRLDVGLFCASIAESNVEIRIAAGLSNTVEGMTEEILAPYVFKHLGVRTYSFYYTPQTSGNIFFGFESLDPSGTHRFNDLGISNILISEVESATPAKIDDLKLEYGSVPGEGELIFTAPDKDVTGNVISSMTKIEVTKNGETIASIVNPVPGQTYRQNITFVPAELTVFGVYAVSGDAASLPAEIKAMVLETPYVQTFETEDSIDGYSVIDVGLDGYTWIYAPNDQAVRSFAMTNNTHNDYLISPAIHFEAGNYYKIDFNTWLDRADSEYLYDNNIEVLLGTAPEIEALNTVVVNPFIVRGDRNQVVLLKDWFTVPATGEYYLAWHSFCSPNLAKELYIDDIRISAKIPDTYPAAVDNFVIRPDGEGALNATIEFDLPVKDMAGRDLTGNFYGYKVYCDGFEISSGEGVPGKHISYTHATQKGVHLFTVRCFGAQDEPTRDVEDIAFIGINRPGPVEFVEVTENPDKYGEITLTWGLPVSDIDGFPLNTTNVTYTIGQYYADPNTGQQQEIEYANNVKALTYTKVIKSNADTQEFMRFFVRANTTAGSGNPTVLTKFTAIGKPFTLPFKESFVNGNPEHIMMQERPFEGRYASWGYNNSNPVTGVQPVDGDGGLCLMETMESGSGARLYTLRIDLNADKPVMTFYVYNQSNSQRTDNNILGVSVREGNGEFETVESKSVDEWAQGHPGWQKVRVDLSKYAHKTVYVAFDCIARNLTFTHIDNVLISEPVDVDVMIKDVAHKKIYVGAEHEIEVKLENLGSKDSGEVEVRLMLDNKLFESRKLDKIASGKEETITFANKLNRNEIGQHQYKAEAVVAGDADLFNNAFEAAKFYLNDNSFPEVRNLTAENEDNNITLNWTEPLIPEEPYEITDDFESYPSWSTMHTGGIGEYTLIDADKNPVGGIMNFDIPNIEYGSQQSFTLWDFSDPHFQYDEAYRAHSGDKCLVSMFTVGEDAWTEDRLISPLLTGEAQTISFYAKCLTPGKNETFQVYYSFDGTTLNDYFDNRFARGAAGSEWTKYSYDLPEGTKYFIIEHYSAGVGGYFFFLDDLTYKAVGDETLQVEGYNVYKNDVLATASPVQTEQWSDSEPIKHETKYGVTAVYDRGESPIVEIKSQPISNGIDSASVTDFKVYTGDNEIIISGAEGFYFTITNASGMIITNRQADSDTMRIPVSSGIYIVSISGKNYKLIIN